MMRFALAALGLLLVCAAASAAGVKTKLSKDENGTVLAFYDAQCGESWEECVFADVTCGKPGVFEASIAGLDQKDIAAWFASSDGNVVVKTDSKSFDLTATSIEYSELGEDWTVTVPGWGFNEEIWQALKASKSVSIVVGKKTVALARKSLSPLIAICAK